MHETTRTTNQLGKLHDAFSSLPNQAMLPADAYSHVVHGTVEPVHLGELRNRTLAVAIVPYPPGIPLLMPGEQSGDPDGPWLAYLAALQSFDRQFPRFEHDIHGIEHVAGDYVALCTQSR
jgi:arginine decarboxylase